MTEERKDQRLREFLEEDQGPLDDQIEDLAGEVKRPPRNDPRHTEGNIPPGERNEPAGGTSGGYMGGSAKKRKGQTG